MGTSGMVKPRESGGIVCKENEDVPPGMRALLQRGFDNKPNINGKGQELEDVYV